MLSDSWVLINLSASTHQVRSQNRLAISCSVSILVTDLFALAEVARTWRDSDSVSGIGNFDTSGAAEPCKRHGSVHG